MKKVLSALLVTVCFCILGFAQSGMKVHAATNEEIAIQRHIEGDELFEQENYIKAISKYSEAIQLNPKLASAYFQRARCYEELANYEQAIKDYKKYLSVPHDDEDDDGNVYAAIAWCYKQLGQYSESKKYYEKARKYGWSGILYAE